MYYTQKQFQQHMNQLRAYAYIQGKNRELDWLWNQYAEQRYTESLEKEFVNDFDAHLEELANTLSPEDFKSLMEFWLPLAKQYWSADQQDAFFKKVKRLKKAYKSAGIAETAPTYGRRIIKDTWSPNIGIVLGGGFLSFLMFTIGKDMQGGTQIVGMGMGILLGLVAVAAVFNTH